MKISFTGYAHVSKEDAEYKIKSICDNRNIKMSDNAREFAMYWGYDIPLQCELDIETGNVDIIGCDGFLIDKTKKLVKEKLWQR